ncbi:hypothetical protein AEST_04980 [Alishewanella aestuarii B11]|uniref:Uncharacterized protein n=1 Tax=Alishewanella aestuarii B11 TaxID=1197174 RepID=J2II91_9ALTE|nr:hypothetical protein AEST_04980 [Alishewanella aestuarii B11]
MLCRRCLVLKLSLKQQVEQQISLTTQDVFLRADFEQLYSKKTF